MLDQQPNSPVAPPLPPASRSSSAWPSRFLWAFDGDQVALAAGCTTSCKSLATPAGDYAVMKHVRSCTFNSLWRNGSTSWYPTVQASYPLFFHEIGYFLHDARWRRVFGLRSK